MITTIVVVYTSFLEGQVTFFSSALTSFKNEKKRLYHLFF